ncbi:class II fructose-bisphosphate aldolase [Desulfosediminicola sp.]|uniref:class II fructose-bisphosphate aldolase n=1 Tax=Desulfosediminicola sp. TaxID=2886825 RepID=UPI003AF1F217
MLIPTGQLLQKATAGGYAIGAFNVYTLEGATAVVTAAEELQSPVMLQVLPSALKIGGRPLVALCHALAKDATVPVAVHLDHCSSQVLTVKAMIWGVSSVMADGSELPFEQNIQFTQYVSEIARGLGAGVEAELGRLSGEEDGIAVHQREALLTSPEQAEEFVEQTGVDALAVCIGNVHGHYRRTPELDFVRLEKIRQRVDVPLVLHGTSGLPDELIDKAITHGICKFNVNTELRRACLKATEACFNEAQTGQQPELTRIMEESVRAMKEVVSEKIKLFRSAEMT